MGPPGRSGRWPRGSERTQRRFRSPPGGSFAGPILVPLASWTPRRERTAIPVNGASRHFRQVRADYEAYVPIVQGALENLDFLIVGSQRSEDAIVFQAAPRNAGDRAVEVEVRRRTRSVNVLLLVYPLALLPTEPHRFRIQEGAFVPISEDAGATSSSANC